MISCMFTPLTPLASDSAIVNWFDTHTNTFTHIFVLLCSCVSPNLMTKNIHWSICHNPLKSSAVLCGLCQCAFHRKCTPIDKTNTNVWLYWTCETCTSIFPFHCLDDSDCVSLLVGQDIDPDNMLFNPLDIYEANYKYNDCVDPDLHFLRFTRDESS